MVLKWIVWYILGLQLFNTKCLIAVELVEEYFEDNIKNNIPKHDIIIRKQITNEDVTSKSIVTVPDSRADNWNEPNLVSSNIEESSRFIVSPLIDATLGIKISLFISDVKADSIQISWKLHTLRSRTNFGLKVGFRPFGSSIEREVIFLVESHSQISNELNYYEISDLTPNTGYVFCFSIINDDGVEVVLESDEYKQVTTKRNLSSTTTTESYPLNTTKKPILTTTKKPVSTTTNKPVSTTIKKILQSTTPNKNLPLTTTKQFQSTTAKKNILSTTTKKIPFTTIKNIISTTAPEEDETTTDIPTTYDARNDILIFETTTTPNFASTPKEIVTERSTPLQALPKKKGSYVYTSTGELIYLPTSAWNPFRRKRSANVLPSRNDFKSHFQKISSSNNVQCTEIFTLQVSIFQAGNVVVLFTAFVIILSVIVFLLMMCCISKLFCKISIVQALKKLTFGIKNTTKLSTEVDVSSAVTYVRDSSTQSRRDSFEESIDIESIAPGDSSKSSSLPSYHEILLRHDITEQQRLDTLKQRKSLDIFHPGYAIPPASTTDAYGYDIPKLSNKQMGPSCSDDISMDDGFNWNDSNIYNWNCHAPRKKSVYASKNVPRLQDIFPPKLSTTNNMDSFYKVKDISDPPEQKLATENDEKNSYTTMDKIATQPDRPERPDRDMEPIQRPYTPNSLYASDMRNSSIGDVTITGGTLIEVPEGYVVPDRSKGLRLVVTGTPIYL